MELKHPFNDFVRAQFIDAQYCWICGRNVNAGLELHHIFGRVSHSAYNAAPLCLKCHDEVTHSFEEHRDLFLKTYEHLKRINYYPSVLLRREDLRFIDYVEAELIHTN